MGSPGSPQAPPPATGSPEDKQVPAAPLGARQDPLAVMSLLSRAHGDRAARAPSVVSVPPACRPEPTAVQAGVSPESTADWPCWEAGGVGLAAEAPPTTGAAGARDGWALGLRASSPGSGLRGQDQGVRPAPGASARPWPTGATASEAAFGQRVRMLPFTPETRARSRATRAPRRRPDGGPCPPLPGQHWPRLREPGQGGLTSSVGPRPWGVPPVPRDEAELGGCHQFRLLRPGLDKDFLCGGNRCLLCREATSRNFQRTRDGKGPGPRASCSGDGELHTEATGEAGTRGRCQEREGPAAGPALPMARRAGWGLQGAVREQEATRNCDRRVWAQGRIPKGALGDATGRSPQG